MLIYRSGEETGSMQTVLGGVAVALIVGLLVGRRYERAARAYKDLKVGRKAVPTLRKGAFKEARKAVLGLGALVFGLVVLFMAASNIAGR
jgi:hypothetical protein